MITLTYGLRLPVAVPEPVPVAPSLLAGVSDIFSKRIMGIKQRAGNHQVLECHEIVAKRRDSSDPLNRDLVRWLM